MGKNPRSSLFLYSLSIFFKAEVTESLKRQQLEIDFFSRPKQSFYRKCGFCHINFLVQQLN